MTRYVALLRGINVGGKNLIAMPRLEACFEALGLSALPADDDPQLEHDQAAA
jgi:uncharacterized protein (DUF1697 family)